MTASRADSVGTRAETVRLTFCGAGLRLRGSGCLLACLVVCLRCGFLGASL